MSVRRQIQSALVRFWRSRWAQKCRTFFCARQNLVKSVTFALMPNCKEIFEEECGYAVDPFTVQLLLSSRNQEPKAASVRQQKHKANVDQTVEKFCIVRQDDASYVHMDEHEVIFRSQWGVSKVTNCKEPVQKYKVSADDQPCER